MRIALVMADFGGFRRGSYTVVEAAAILGLARWTVRQMCNKGELEAFRLVDGPGGLAKWRIGNEELERYRREGKRRPPQQD